MGDVLLRVDGIECTTFVALEGLVDARVGKTVKYTVERGGGECPTTLLPMPAFTPCSRYCLLRLNHPPPLLLLNPLPKSVELEFWVLVADLHRLTPSNFLEASGAILHPISYMQARNGNLAINSGL